MDLTGIPARAVAAAVELAAVHGVRSDDPVVLCDGANVVVHLRPAPLVAKVSATTHLVREPEAWLARELDVAQHLEAAGIPVVAASDLVPPGVHRHGGHLMSFWRHLPHDPEATVPPEVLGEMLREAHQALAGYTSPLPYLATPLEDVSRFLARADPRATAGMRRAFEQVVRALPDNRGQALHGDPHPGNLLAAAGGWTWADLEDTCAGPVAWDLACLATSTRTDPERALRAYGDVPELAPWTALRRLHAGAWTCLYAERLPGHRPRAAELLAAWG